VQCNSDGEGSSVPIKPNFAQFSTIYRPACQNCEYKPTYTNSTLLQHFTLDRNDTVIAYTCSNWQPAAPSARWDYILV